MTTIIAVLTAHNRRASTVEALSHLKASADFGAVQVQAILVDDGSTDGTAEAVQAGHPWVKVLKGDGALFWNLGMRRGMQDALKADHVDFILWLNDDTLLEKEALHDLLTTSAAVEEREGAPVIVVGATCDAASGKLTYGGCEPVSKWRRFTFRRVFQLGHTIECRTMNGNVVLLPMAVARDVGNLDPAFLHAMGDIDYGLRARRKGYRIFVAPRFAGICSNNPSAGSHQDATLPFKARWKKLVHRKALPPRSWLRLTRQHGGLLWPLYFAFPYIRLAISSAIKRRSSKTSH